MLKIGFGLDSAPLLRELDDIEHRQLPFVQMLAAYPAGPAGQGGHAAGDEGPA